MKIICNVLQEYHKEYFITLYQISDVNMVIEQENKMPTGPDGHLSTIALTLTCQRVSVFHFKLSFKNTNPNLKFGKFHEYHIHAFSLSLPDMDREKKIF